MSRSLVVGGCLLFLGVVHVCQRQEAAVVLEGGGDDGGYLRGPSGWRWIKQKANLQTPEYYRHPLSTIGEIDPYRDLPMATQRGLPDMARTYDVSVARMDAPPEQEAGMKAVFSQSRAAKDLAALREFGLVGDEAYRRKRHQILSDTLDPFVKREGLPEPGKPEGWTGPTKMCRDVTTTVNGLSSEGWSRLNTLRCCNYLCTHTQWNALRQGELKWGYGPSAQYSRAVHTGAASKLADGSERYLCKSCAWTKEPAYPDQMTQA